MQCYHTIDFPPTAAVKELYWRWRQNVATPWSWQAWRFWKSAARELTPVYNAVFFFSLSISPVGRKVQEIWHSPSLELCMTMAARVRDIFSFVLYVSKSQLIQILFFQCRGIMEDQDVELGSDEINEHTSRPISDDDEDSIDVEDPGELFADKATMSDSNIKDKAQASTSKSEGKIGFSIANIMGFGSEKEQDDVSESAGSQLKLWKPKPVRESTMQQQQQPSGPMALLRQYSLLGNAGLLSSYNSMFSSVKPKQDEIEDNFEKTNPKQKTYPCPECGKIFNAHYNLTRHMPVHTGNTKIEDVIQLIDILWTFDQVLDHSFVKFVAKGFDKRPHCVATRLFTRTKSRTNVRLAAKHLTEVLLWTLTWGFIRATSRGFVSFVAKVSIKKATTKIIDWHTLGRKHTSATFAIRHFIRYDLKEYKIIQNTFTHYYRSTILRFICIPTMSKSHLHVNSVRKAFVAILIWKNTCVSCIIPISSRRLAVRMTWA